MHLQSQALLLLFVEEADRLSREGQLLKAVVSLGNAACCRGASAANRREITQIMQAMMNEHSKRLGRKANGKS
jgi:hypothetical protein